MALRETITDWTQRSAPFVGFLLLLGLAVAIVMFVPSRGAAALLGILFGAGLSYALTSRARHTVQIGVLWAAVAVAADAAYARLNDQPPVTLANALTKMVDALVKLADPLIRGVGLAATDPRAKVGAVAPDFVWALILSLIAFIVIGFTLSARDRR